MKSLLSDKSWADDRTGCRALDSGRKEMVARATKYLRMADSQGLEALWWAYLESTRVIPAIIKMSHSDKVPMLDGDASLIDAVL